MMQKKLNHSFFDQYSGSFADNVIDKFFEENDVITGKEIINLTPSKQVNFFVLKMLFNEWQDEMKKLESPFFDFKDTEVRKALRTFMNTVSQKIEIEERDFKPLLERAVRETLHLLANPAEFLEQSFADRKSDLSEKSVKNFLKYIKVFKSDIEQFLESNIGQPSEEIGHSSRVFFDSLDVEQIAGFELSILNEIEPITMGDLIEEEIAEPEQEAPDEEELDLSVDDFDDEPELEVEEGAEEDVSEPHVEAEALEATSDEEAEAFDPESEESDAEAPMPEEAETESLEPEPAEEELEPEAEDEPELEDEEVADEATDEEEDSLEPEESPEEEKTPETAAEVVDFEEDEEVSLNQKLADETTKTINEKFEREESVTLADHHQQSKVTSIMEAISVNNRYMFINDLFEGDKDEFADAIDRIEECESFDEAVEILVQEYARNYEWDMNSDEVKELLKVVFRKFR
ncbi:MAG: hypothetical protein ABJG41_15435 [Cyclobacteriaceae bacterium]